MATIDVKDAQNDTIAVQLPLAPGRAAAASSRPVVLSTEDLAALANPTPKFIVASGTALTRPAHTDAYAAGDSVSNHATAGSVTANVITVTDASNEPFT